MLARDLLEALLQRDRASIRAIVSERLDVNGFEDTLSQITQFAVLAYAPGEHSRAALGGADALHVIHDDLEGSVAREQLLEIACMAADARRPWSEAPITSPPPATEADGAAGALERAVETRDRVAAERWIAFHRDAPNLGRMLFDHASRVVDDDHASMRTTAIAWRIAQKVPAEHRFGVLRIAAVEWAAGHRWEQGSPESSGLDYAHLAERLVALYASESGSPLRLQDIAALDAAQLGSEQGSTESAAWLATRVRIPSAVNAAPDLPRGTLGHSPREDFAAALMAWAIAKRRSHDWSHETLSALKAASLGAATAGLWAEGESI